MYSNSIAGPGLQPVARHITTAVWLAPRLPFLSERRWRRWFMAKPNAGRIVTFAVADTTSFKDPDDLAPRRQTSGKSDLFSDQIIDSLSHSLPEPVCQRRRELLPQILHEWNRTDLQRHLSLDSRAVTRARIGRVERVRDCARELLHALNAAGEEWPAIKSEMLMRAEGRSLNEVSRSTWADLTRRLDEESHFLAKLAAIAPEGWRKRGSGRPRNFAAYLVLSDAAAIFAWYTGKKATRVVDRSDNTETGPFFRFAGTLWPVVFGRDIHGLPAAMKNWAQERSRYSPLIANIDLRRPTWGIREC